MVETTNEIIEKYRFKQNRDDECFCEEESWTSSDLEEKEIVCPSIRSYSSLEKLSCSDSDEEQCRMVKLNNLLKDAVDLINDPTKKHNVKAICHALCLLLKCYGTEGYYMKHLPQIGEILEFVAMKSKNVEEYRCLLNQLIELAINPILIEKASDVLACHRTLERHMSLLGYLLALVPTKESFFLVKAAIERVTCIAEESRRDAIKVAYRVKALEGSRLVPTLLELTEVATAETYPVILEMMYTVASVSPASCQRLLEGGLEAVLLPRMHPGYQDGFQSKPITDSTDLHLEKEDYHAELDFGVKILLRSTTVILKNEAPPPAQNLLSPSTPALWCLRAAFRREVLRAGRSPRSRRLRNQIASLMLANLLAQTCGTKWDFLESGLAEDIGILAAATEKGACGTWAEGAVFETTTCDSLVFKNMLLRLLCHLMEAQPHCVTVLKNRQIISALLKLVNPHFDNEKSPWNSEQLWHLFKFASNALIYLVPKIPEEFLEDYGSLRLLHLLKKLINDNYDEPNNLCITDMFYCISVSDSPDILNDFRKHCFIPTFLKLISLILDCEALTSIRQQMITFSLTTCEYILGEQRSFKHMACTDIVTLDVILLQRCLHQKLMDSELEDSFLVAIGTSIWKCIVTCKDCAKTFMSQGGFFALLDLIDKMKLSLQNLYLGLIVDLCENEDNSHFLLTWRNTTADTGIMALFARIWRAEEKMFNVQRSDTGCIKDVDEPLKDDEHWLYYYFTKSSIIPTTATTVALGSIRPKIFYLRKYILTHIQPHQIDYLPRLFSELSLQDQLTIVLIDAYKELKESEMMIELNNILEKTNARPLSKSRRPVRDIRWKIVDWANRVKETQEAILEQVHMEDIVKERMTYQKLLDSRLQSDFKVLGENSLMAKTSSRDCMIAKKNEQRAAVEAGVQEIIKDGDVKLCRTSDPEQNVTNVFKQRSTVKIIPNEVQKSECSKTLNNSKDSSLNNAILSTTSTRSLTSFCSDSSFLLKKYRLTSSGRFTTK